MNYYGVKNIGDGKIMSGAQVVRLGSISNYFKRLDKKVPEQQLSFFGQKPPILEELAKLDIDSLTPLEALTRLYELQKKAREG